MTVLILENHSQIVSFVNKHYLFYDIIIREPNWGAFRSRFLLTGASGRRRRGKDGAGRLRQRRKQDSVRLVAGFCNCIKISLVADP